jgi:hypothetical protein
MLLSLSCSRRDSQSALMSARTIAILERLAYDRMVQEQAAQPALSFSCNACGCALTSCSGTSVWRAGSLAWQPPASVCHAHSPWGLVEERLDNDCRVHARGDGACAMQRCLQVCISELQRTGVCVNKQLDGLGNKKIEDATGNMQRLHAALLLHLCTERKRLRALATFFGYNCCQVRRSVCSHDVLEPLAKDATHGVLILRHADCQVERQRAA